MRVCVPTPDTRLWGLAIDTKDDILGRIGVVPLVQEARGLDAGDKIL